MDQKMSLQIDLVERWSTVDGLEQRSEKLLQPPAVQRFQTIGNSWEMFACLVKIFKHFE